MKNVWLLVGCLALAFPAFADEVPDEEAPAEEPAPVEPAPEEEVAVEEPPAEEPPAEEEYVAEEAPAEDEDPTLFYIGADARRLFVSFSDETLKQRFGGSKFSSNFFSVRAGIRVFEVVGLEVNYGQGHDSDDTIEPGKLHTDTYWGFYAVPTGTFLDTVEIGVPIGFSILNVSNAADQRHDFQRMSFGLNIELPFRVFGETLPDLRIGGGGMVYQAENHARAYGFHAGLRMDFRI